MTLLIKDHFNVIKIRPIERTNPIRDIERNSSDHWQNWHADSIHPANIKIYKQLCVSIIQAKWRTEILVIEIILCIPMIPNTHKNLVRILIKDCFDTDSDQELTRFAYYRPFPYLPSGSSPTFLSSTYIYNTHIASQYEAKEEMV